MKSQDILFAMNDIDDALITDALEAPARAWFRPALIAACLTLILVAIPVGIMISKSTITPNVPVIDPNTSDHTVTTTQAPPTTQAPETTARPSILDIPGATVLDENDNRFYKEGRPCSYSGLFSEERTREMLQNMKENNAIVIGYIQDYTTVLVEDGEDYYQITTMTIQVLENVIGIEKKTITAVYACRYYND